MVQYKNVLLVPKVDFDMYHYVHNYHFHTIGHYNHEHIDIQLWNCRHKRSGFSKFT